jgi:hypothetical protein
MVKIKGQTMIYKAIDNKFNIEKHEPYKNLVLTSDTPEG